MEGGLGGELHLYQAHEEIQLSEYGPVEQVEFSTHHRNEFVQAKEQLDEIGIPYQTLEQEESESLRITESSGISFIFTLEK